MSLAKKSVKWLVALFVIFALILTASVAVSNVARANAEPLETAEDTTAPSTVIVEVTDSVGNVYPNLANVANAARTLTVNYYVEIPSAAQEGEYSILKFSPVLVYVDDTHVAKPNVIELNTALESKASLEYVTEYRNGTANAFGVSLKTGATIGDLNGVTAGETNGNYLFTATYVLNYGVEEAVLGEYALTFADDEQDEDDGSAIAPTDEGLVYIPAISNSAFYIRTVVPVPTYDTDVVDAETHTVVYDGTVKNAVSFNNDYADLVTVTGSVSATNAGEYPVTFALKNTNVSIWDLGNGTYTVEDQVRSWEITKREVTLAFNDNNEGYTVTYEATPAAVAVGVTGLAAEGDLGSIGYSIVKDAQQYISLENLSVGTYTLTTTYTANDNYEVTPDTATYTVNRLKVAKPTVGTANYVYDGTEKTYSFSEVDTAHVVIMDNVQINAGTYSPSAHLKDLDNLEWADDNDTVDVATVYYTNAFVISKRSVTVPVSAGNTYTYNGQAQSFAFSEDSLIDAAYITITGTPQTDVGNYTVTAALNSKANMYWGNDVNDNADKTYEFVINPILIPVPTPADVTYTYNGEEQTFQWASTPHGDIAITGDVQTDADEYTVTISLLAGRAWNDENHTTAAKTFPFVINKKVIPVPTAKTNLVYTGSTITGVDTTGIDEGDIHFVEGNGSTKAAINAGDYTAVYELNDNQGNTKWEGTDEATVSINWTIGKKTITEPTSFYYNRVYNGQLQSLTDVQTWYTVTSQGGTNAGEYDITVTLKDTNNTKWAAHESASYDVEDAFRIGRFTVHLVINKTATESYYGQQVATITVTTEETLIHEGDLGTLGYTAKRYVPGTGDVTLTKAEFESSNPYPDAGNYVIDAVYSNDNPNYYVPNLPSFPYEIKKVTVTAPVLEGETTTFGYDGSTHGISFTEASLVDAALITFTGTQSATSVGEYTYTASLPDTNNYKWSDSTTAAKSFPWSITVKNITKPTPLDNVQYVYDSYNKQFMLDVVSAETGYYTVSNNIRKNAGTQTVTVSLKDKSNTQWADGTTADLEFSFTVQRRPVNISVSADAASHVYGNTPANVSISMTGAIDAISSSYKVICVDGEEPYAEYNPTQFNAGLNVGHYTLNAIYNDINGNYDVTVSQPFAYEITTRYITVPTATTHTYPYDGQAHAIEFSNVDDTYVDVAVVSESAIGTYPVAVSLKAAYAGNVAWDDENHTTAAKTYTLTIEVSEITFTVIPVYNDVAKSGTEVTVNVFAALPAATNYRWFKFTGYTFDNAAATTATLAMSGSTLYANYTYAVGLGDANGDGVISSLDVIQLKRWNVGLDRAKKIADADAAWGKTDDTSVTSAVLYTALDANNSGKFTSTDIVAAREALATGYNFKIIVSEGIIQVAKVNRVNVSNYGDLIANIEMGNAVTLTTDIDAANEVFNENLVIPVDIDLGNHRLTVKGFTLNTATSGATLKVTNGTLYTVTGITVTAPNGNVVVADVNGYSYDGTVVNLAAYSESLHIEDDVAFYIYKAQLPGTTTDYADVDAFIADVYPDEEAVVTEEVITNLNTTITTLANTRIGETAARMADIATIKADTTKDEGQKATAINALDVKKAILEVPIDTHVVVEETAKLSADKIVVKAQSDTGAPAVTTFAIEVKNAAAEVVTVDISEVKDDTGAEVVYVVDEVAVSGNTAKVEVVAGDNTAAEVKKYVAQIGTTNYESLQAAIDAAVNYDTIKLLASVTDGTGLKTADDNAQKTKVGKTFTIDFGGFTYTVNGASVGSTGTETQAMHWGEKDNITLKNGTFVVSENAATVAGSNGKIVKMAMQNYANLTVKDMTMDFSNIVVQNYGDYTGTVYEAYTGLEISLFNTNAGSINIEGSTITMPANSTKGICINIAGATITNSTINGAVSLNSDDADPSVTVTGSTITKGVVAYFAADMVTEKNGVWTVVDAIEVYNAAELTEALAAGANKIIVMDDISSTNGFLVASNAKINLNNHTVTVETGANVNNRAFKVTNGTLEIYNGEIIAQGGGTTSSNGYGCYGSFRAEVGTTLIAHDLTLRNSRPWGLNVKLLGASAELTNVDIISAYGGGIEVTDDDGADGTVQGYAKMVDCSVTQTGYFDHCSSAVSVSGNSTLDVYSTTYTAETAIYVFSSGGTINVYGGEFTGNRNAIVVASDLNSYPNAACIVNVYDSEINGTFSHSGKACDKINIYGGTFDHDPTAYVVEGYAAVEEDGVWTIVPATIVTNEAELKAAVAANAPYIVVGDDFSLASTVSLSGGKNITIDMNGHTITSNDKVLFSVYAGNSLEFTGNGTIALNNPSKTTRPAMWIEGSTNVASVRESYLTIGEGVTVTSTGYGLVLYEVTGTNYAYGVVITVDGTITTNRNAAICAIGNIAQHDGDVVIGEPIAAISEINIGSTASLTAMNSAIYAAGFAVWNIESGAHLTGADAIYAKSGYLTIGDDVILTATKDPATPYAYNGNGENPTGDGIVIDSCNYPGKAPVVNYTSALLDNITVTAEGAQKVGIYWAVANETELNEAIAAKAPYIYLRNSFAISETIVVDYETVLNMNGKTLYNEEDLWEQYPGDWSIISVREDGNLTITGDGTISAKENDCYAIDVVDGATLVIEDGTYVGNVSAVYICHGGNVTINGGDFSLLQLYPDERYMLNCLDADYTAGTANFTVKGGIFHGFNPADNASEGAHTDYLAEGYVATLNNDIWMVEAIADTEAVARIGKVAYATFDAAVAAAQDGDTIVLLADVTYGTDRVVPVWEIKAFNIDLNGKTFTTNSNQGISLSNNGYGASAICYGDNENTSPARNITVSNGTIRTAYGAGLYFDAAVTATLENLTVAQNYPANVQSTDEYSAAVRLTSGATVNIYSGTYSGKNAIAISNSGGYANIYGGDFRGVLFINGGASSTKVLTICGGTFDHDPTAYVDTTAYDVTEANGIYTVSAKA